MDILLLVFQTVLKGLPFLISHFLVTCFIFFLGLWVYLKITPFDEFDLIKKGNVAASISLMGASLGIALPLAFCLSSSLNIIDIIIWGSISVLIQLFCYKFVDYILKDLPKRIEDGQISSAVFLFSLKISLSFVNSAAISG